MDDAFAKRGCGAVAGWRSDLREKRDEKDKRRSTLVLRRLFDSPLVRTAVSLRRIHYLVTARRDMLVNGRFRAPRQRYFGFDVPPGEPPWIPPPPYSL